MASDIRSEQATDKNHLFQSRLGSRLHRRNGRNFRCPFHIRSSIPSLPKRWETKKTKTRLALPLDEVIERKNKTLASFLSVLSRRLFLANDRGLGSGALPSIHYPFQKQQSTSNTTTTSQYFEIVDITEQRTARSSLPTDDRSQ